MIAFAAYTLGAEGPYYPKPSNPAYSKSYDYVSRITYCHTIVNVGLYNYNSFIIYITQAPMPYSFSWGVKDDASYNDYAHQESNDGKVTTGSYRVLLPDGRTQIVTYKADDYGYNADVKYEGEIRPYEYKPSYKATYPAAPAPVYPAEPSYSKPSYPEPAYATKPSYEPAYKPVPPPAYYPRPSYPATPRPSYPRPPVYRAPEKPVVEMTTEEIAVVSDEPATAPPSDAKTKEVAIPEPAAIIPDEVEPEIVFEPVKMQMMEAEAKPESEAKPNAAIEPETTTDTV